MATLRETAMAYEPPQQTKNIAELEKIPVDIELKDGSAKNNAGEEFKYKFAEIEGIKYRIAGSIIGGIKTLLKRMPNLKYVQVLKEGAGINTKYQVIPYSDSLDFKEGQAIFKKIEHNKDNISLCPSCNCMTRTIRTGIAEYKCGKCGQDKIEGDRR